MVNFSNNDIAQALNRWEEGLAPPARTRADALATLAKKRVSDAEADFLLSGFVVADREVPDPRMITYYYYNHGIDHLDAASRRVDLGDDFSTAAVRSIFQCAELCIYNLTQLAKRARQDVERGDFGSAYEKARWIDAGNATLDQLSQLLPKLRRDLPDETVNIGLQHSPNLPPLVDAIQQYHESLIKAGLVDTHQFSERGLGDQGRALTHLALIAHNYGVLWKLHLKDIAVPAHPALQGKPEREAYITFVAPDLVRETLASTALKDETFFSEFHLYHLLSESVAQVANQMMARATKNLTSDNPHLPQALEDTENALSLLSTLPKNIGPLLDNVSQGAYNRFRPYLGVSSGLESPNISNGTLKVAPLFIQAVRNYVMGRDDYDEQALTLRLNDLVKKRKTSADAALKYNLLQQALGVSLVMSQFRDEHIKLLTVQFGIPLEGKGPASLSGSNDGMKVGHQISARQHVPTQDPITPISEALAGGSRYHGIMSPPAWRDQITGPVAQMLDVASRSITALTEQRKAPLQQPRS